jgi:hypothetical protein
MKFIDMGLICVVNPVISLGIDNLWAGNWFFENQKIYITCLALPCTYHSMKWQDPLWVGWVFNFFLITYPDD